MDKNGIKQIRHLLMCLVKDEHHVRCTLEVKDEQTRLSLHGWGQGRTDEQPSRYCLRRNAAEKWHPTRHDGMSEIDLPHVFQGPNYAWCAWKVAFVAFHTFLVDSRLTNWAEIELGPTYSVCLTFSFGVSGGVSFSALWALKTQPSRGHFESAIKPNW